MGWTSYVTIEPTMFLQQAGDTLTYVIFQNLFIEKICRVDLGYSRNVCDLYSESSQGELAPEEQTFRPILREIQAKSSQFLLYNSLVENSLPVFLVLFLGVWSDRHRKRKPPMLLCLTGKMLRSFGLLMNSYYLSWPSFVLLLTVSLPHSLGGSNAVFHMSAFSYIADSSVPRQRTWRLGVAEFCWQLGAPVGLYLGAILYEKGGYLWVFGTSFTLHLVSVLYTAFLCPEVPKPEPSKHMVFGKHGNYGTYTTPQPFNGKRMRFYSEAECLRYNGVDNGKLSFGSGEHQLRSQESEEDLSRYLAEVSEVDMETSTSSSDSEYVSYQATASLFPNTVVHPHLSHAIPITSVDNSDYDPNNNMTVKDIVVGSIRSILRQRPNHTRKCLISIGIIMLSYGIAVNGEGNMKYLFTRNKFNWREQQFSLWIVFESLVVVTGLLVVMPILSKCFKFSDPLCGTIAAFTRASSRICIALAPKSIYLYAGSLIDLPGVIGPLTARSLASKCVLRDERGKIFAFLGCIEAIVPLIAVPLYSLIYTSTLSSAPSAIYFVSAGIYGTIFLLFGTLFIAHKLKLIHFSGNDLTSLLGNHDPNSTSTPGMQYACSMYRRSSLS